MNWKLGLMDMRMMLAAKCHGHTKIIEFCHAETLNPFKISIRSKITSSLHSNGKSSNKAVEITNKLLSSLQSKKNPSRNLSIIIDS
jgi:hypothetical protein